MEFLSLLAIIMSVIALRKSSQALEAIAKLSSGHKGVEHKEPARLINPHPYGTSVPVAVNTLPVEHAHEQISNEDTTFTDGSGDLKVVKPEVKEHTHSTPQKEYGADFANWLKEDWLLKLGGVLVIMGVLFFLSLAYNHVGPAGKVTIGYLFGTTLTVFGFWYAKRQLVGGSTIHLVGAIVVLITTYIARRPEYNLFNPFLALLLMFFTSACVALTAYAYKRSELAHVGLFMAMIVPILANSGQKNFTGLLLYLGVVVLGMLWLAYVTIWRTLIVLALLGVAGYSSFFILGAMGDAPMTLLQILLVTAFGILFFMTSLFSIMRTKGNANPVDGFVALLNAGYAIMWIVGEATTEHAPIILALVGFVYAAGFFCVYKITNVYTSFLIYGSVALGMLATSVTLELSGRAETIALLLMGAGASVFTYHLSKDENVTKIISFFNILPLMYVFGSLGAIDRAVGSTFSHPDLWKDYLIVGLATAVYLSLYAYFVKRSKTLSNISLFAGITLIVITTWETLHLFISEDFATNLSLLIIGVGLTIFTYFFSDKDEKTTGAVSFINILTVVCALRSVALIADQMYRTLPNPEIWKDWFFVIMVMCIAFVFYGFFVRRWERLGYASLTVALTFLVTTIWQVLHTMMSAGLATFSSLFIYTVVGLFILYQATEERRETKIKLANAWLICVALRVIVHDAWQAGSVALGVLICIVIGLLFLSSAFIIKKVAKE